MVLIGSPLVFFGGRWAWGGVLKAWTTALPSVSDAFSVVGVSVSFLVFIVVQFVCFKGPMTPEEHKLTDRCWHT